MRLKTKARKPILKDECYNCHMLYGWPFNPRCFVRKNPIRDDSDERCAKYTPIVKENKE